VRIGIKNVIFGIVIVWLCLVMFMCIYLNCKKKCGQASRDTLFFINAVHLLR
jgi:hypothetical protein